MRFLIAHMFFSFSRFSLSLPLDAVGLGRAWRVCCNAKHGWLLAAHVILRACRSGIACSHDRLRYSYVEVYGPENARETFHSSFHCIGFSVCSGGFEMLVTGFIDASLEVLSRPAQGASSSFPRSWRVELVEAWNKCPVMEGTSSGRCNVIARLFMTIFHTCRF